MEKIKHNFERSSLLNKSFLTDVLYNHFKLDVHVRVFE